MLICLCTTLVGPHRWAQLQTLSQKAQLHGHTSTPWRPQALAQQA